jgi:predicted metal-dependent enzyme (double-stranded beta helix superfamily)
MISVPALRAAIPDARGPALLDALVRATASTVTPPVSAPPGRYLLHAEAGWNLQLDVFSAGYVGGVHAHGTWGAFLVLTGRLWSEDWTVDERGARVGRIATLGPGSGQAFDGPDQDWHRVGAPVDGPPTTSLHVYGPGFDLDRGVRLDADGRPIAYARGPLGDLRALAGFVTWGAS